MTKTLVRTPRTILVTASMAVTLIATLAACTGSKEPAGLGTTQLSVSTDTVSGTGQLAELQQRRAAWIARGINDYRVQLQITCFCGGDIRRPVLLEVRGGAVTKVWDMETGRPVTALANYPSITTLFDRAVGERSGGGYVSVAYDVAHGFPARIEIGTLANDAGTLYTLGGFQPL